MSTDTKVSEDFKDGHTVMDRWVHRTEITPTKMEVLTKSLEKLKELSKKDETHADFYLGLISGAESYLLRVGGSKK